LICIPAEDFDESGNEENEDDQEASDFEFEEMDTKPETDVQNTTDAEHLKTGVNKAEVGKMKEKQEAVLKESPGVKRPAQVI